MHFFIDLSTGHLIDTRGVPGRAYARIPHTRAGHNGHARLSHIVDIMHTRLLLAYLVRAGVRWCALYVTRVRQTCPWEAIERVLRASQGRGRVIGQGAVCNASQNFFDYIYINTIYSNFRYMLKSAM